MRGLPLGYREDADEHDRGYEADYHRTDSNVREALHLDYSIVVIQGPPRNACESEKSEITRNTVVACPKTLRPQRRLPFRARVIID